MRTFVLSCVFLASFCLAIPLTFAPNIRGALEAIIQPNVVETLNNVIFDQINGYKHLVSHYINDCATDTEEMQGRDCKPPIASTPVSNDHITSQDQVPKQKDTPGLSMAVTGSSTEVSVVDATRSAHRFHHRRGPPHESKNRGESVLPNADSSPTKSAATTPDRPNKQKLPSKQSQGEGGDAHTNWWGGYFWGW
ncbi:hypothetical protein M408DRAFT_91979 [Serendipita vermifera MAFF 305830]|uniref:Uncharacterized protein n=1 Tax=Serendipita vermifera MAFF 305830 TaxID=933852 RepID=A0A0C3BS46_SERVB|nr:hypothetical protein M408DRAFT_91979 [Serendipita vermifera MAFF 305830]